MAASGICSVIDVGHKLQPFLDQTRNYLGIDLIYNGIHLPQGYDGSGVVVGIIDDGFEYTHPSFYDTAGNTLRVKRVWNQRDTTGTAPSGFSYGSEYSTTNEIIASPTDDDSAVHGSHVAGIAAGCGAPSGNGTAYRGMAPGADIVLVSSIFTEASVLDAIQYINNYARSVGKPCVINMSFGTLVGSHDGTGLSDRFFTSYISENTDSIALVASAGNSGDENAHIEKHFSTTDTSFTSNLDFYSLRDLSGEIGLWCDRNFRFALSLVNSNTNVQDDFSGFFATGTDTLIETQLWSSDSTKFDLTIHLSSLDTTNNRYHAFVTFSDRPSFRNKLYLTVRCDTTAVMHGWGDAFTFEADNIVSGTIGGDSLYTIGGFGANTDAVISVGAYTTRHKAVTYDGETIQYNEKIGQITSFSSMGPTLDGRVKPDIAAPGELVVSAYNTFGTNAIMTMVYDTTMWSGRTAEYGIESGTSMSSPMVTGIVALWMQHNPALGTDSLRAIMHRTARNDRFTGNAAVSPNNIWGYGKVNAFGGLPADTAMWLLNVLSCDEGTGTVSGSGVVAEGSHTIAATPANNYIFARWDDGDTNNPRLVNVISDTTFSAVFIPDCRPITTFPWWAETDQNFTCWEIIDGNNDNLSWRKMASGLAVSNGNDTTDDWIVSPKIIVNQSLVTNVYTRALTFTMGRQGGQDCSLLISTTGTAMSDFTTVLDSHTFTNLNESYMLSASLSDYQGSEVYLAVRHHNCISNALLLYIDSLCVLRDSTVAIHDVQNADFVIATNGLQFRVTGAEWRPMRVFDMMGRMVLYSPTTEGTFRVAMPGIYVIEVKGLKPKKTALINL